MDLERINTLWEGAERLRSHLDSADYKRLVLGLVFLKHLSDDSEARVSGSGKTPFQVPAIARWEAIRSQAGQSDIANRIDDAILALHRSNPSLAVILPARFASAAEVAPGTIGGLIDLLSPFRSGANDPAVDTLGEVFEWLLEQFAQTGGKKGGRFHTPASLTRLLLEVLSPRAGRIYDPACGEGDILIQCGKYATNRGSGKEGFSLFGQEADPAAWRLAAMHLAVQGMAADLGTGPGDPFARDYHPGLRFDYILAVTLFAGTSRSSELVPDPRWSYGTPSSTRDGFAWLQLVLWHLAPSGFAGVVLGNGSMHSNQGTDGAIRRALVEGDQVEVMIALPPGLFSNSLIPACVWFLAKDKTKEGRDRRRECLFIDTGSYGWVESPSRRVLQSEDIRRIARTVHAWRQDGGAREAYADIPGFCRSVGLAEIAEQGFLLTPKRYVGGGGLKTAASRAHPWRNSRCPSGPRWRRQGP